MLTFARQYFVSRLPYFITKHTVLSLTRPQPLPWFSADDALVLSMCVLSQFTAKDTCEIINGISYSTKYRFRLAPHLQSPLVEEHNSVMLRNAASQMFQYRKVRISNNIAKCQNILHNIVILFRQKRQVTRGAAYLMSEVKF